MGKPGQPVMKNNVLRKFEVVEIADCQDGWKVETRKRLTGKLRGNTYKVFVDGDGSKFYSLSKALKNGFKADGTVDGRKTRHKSGKATQKK